MVKPNHWNGLTTNLVRRIRNIFQSLICSFMVKPNHWNGLTTNLGRRIRNKDSSMILNQIFCSSEQGDSMTYPYPLFDSMPYKKVVGRNRTTVGLMSCYSQFEAVHSNTLCLPQPPILPHNG